MRVGLVVERYASRGGGVEGVAWNLARELALRDAKVTVVCRKASGPPPAGVELRRVSAPGFWQVLRVPAFSRGARRATRSGFDVVHSLARTRHQDVYRTGGGSHAAYMEAVYRRPEVRARFSPRHRVLLRIEEQVFGDPDQLIQCNARLGAQEIARRFDVPPERLAVIYNGVDTERFHPARRQEHRAAVRGELRLDGPVALFVGHAFHRKGLDLAIRGLARGAPPDATLVVVGADDPAPYRALATRHGIAGRVRFLGARTDVERLHAAADLFVLPTRYDPFANACLEAMASGLPVLTSPANGAAELIAPAEAGIVAASRVHRAFRLLSSPETLHGMGRAARAVAEKRTWARHAEEVLQLYARVRS